MSSSEKARASTLADFHALIMSHLPAWRAAGADPSDGVAASSSVLTLTGFCATKQTNITKNNILKY